MFTSTHFQRRHVSRIGRAASIIFVLMFAGCEEKESLNKFEDFTFTGQQASKSSSDDIGSSVRKIEVDNQFGDVVISVSAGPSVMQWECSVWAVDESEAERFLSQVELKQFKTGFTETWTLNAPRGPWVVDGIKSRINISIPPTVKVQVTNRFGNVFVSNCESTVKLDNQNGNITVANVSGDCEIENNYGSVEVVNATTCRVSNRFGNTNISDVVGSLHAKNAFGQLQVNRIVGTATLENNRGNIIASDIDGKTTATTTSASLTVTRLSGDAHLINTRGKISASALAGGDLRIENSFGPIYAETDARTIECKNQNGEIEVHLTNAEFKSVQMQTQFNDLVATVPDRITPNLNLDAGGGMIESEFETSSAIDAPVIQLATEKGNVILKKSGLY